MQALATLKTKDDLIAEIQKERTTLDTIVQKVPSDIINVPGACDDWSVKDILAHIWEWQNMMIKWYEDGISGKQVHTPKEGYTWAMVKELNHAIYEQHKNDRLEDIQKGISDCETKIIEILKKLDDQEIFEKGKFSWIGNGKFVSFVRPCTAGHYRWGRKLISAWLKKRV